MSLGVFIEFFSVLEKRLVRSNVVINKRKYNKNGNESDPVVPLSTRD